LDHNSKNKKHLKNAKIKAPPSSNHLSLDGLYENIGSIIQPEEDFREKTSSL